MKKKVSIFGLVAAIVLSLAAGAVLGGGYVTQAVGGRESYQYAKKFAEIISVVENNYVGDADKEFMTDIGYKALTEAVGDRWSYYMNPVEYEAYKEYQSNSYTGIGITIALDEEADLPVVAGVLEDSAAQNAGMEIGDVLSSIDGVSLKGLTISEVKGIVVSKGETKFTIMLLDESGVEREISVQAGVVFSKPVKYELLPDGIGYVKIKNFEGESASMTIAAVDKLIAQGAKGIVFDVRNNPGGLLSELIEALDHLMPEGEVFVSVDKNGTETVMSTTAGCVEIPMAVLVNNNSYSAAEFFAAALSEYDLATVVGINTTGKSRSQINIELSDGSVVHLSTRGYLTPNRVDLAKQGGLVPDIVVELSEEETAYLTAGRLDFDKDGQLQAAKKALLSQMGE